MFKNVFFLVLLFPLLNYSQISAGKSPQFYDPLPIDLKLEYSKTLYLINENTETDTYWFEINEFPFMMIKTSGIPDCTLIAQNSFGGGDIYKKLKDNRYQRIIEVRDHKDFFAIYSVDDNNETKKILEVSKNDNSIIISLLQGYGLYWNSNSTK